MVWGTNGGAVQAERLGYAEPGGPKVYCAMNVSLRIEDRIRKYGIDQNADVAVFLQEHTGLGMRVVKAPGPNKHFLEQEQTAASPREQTWFRSVLMSASWFAVSTRFDISQTISRSAQKMAVPTVSAVSELKRLVAYLMHRPKFTLTVCRVGRTENEYGFYVDSDHAGAQPYTPKSHTGIILMINGMPVLWKSNKQPIAALSSATTEIYAFSECIKQVNLLLWRAEELGVVVPWPVNIYENNKATISVQKSTTPNSKLKGIYNLRWNWVVQLRNKLKYTATKVNTLENFSWLTCLLNALLWRKCFTLAEMTRMLKRFKGV